MKKLLGITVLALGSVAIAGAASLTYSLNLDACTGGCGTPPFGTVTLTQDGDKVDVDVTLLNGNQFIRTGAGQSLAFNVSGNPSIDITNITAGFSNTGATSASAFGSFFDSVGCTGCGPGGSSPNPGPLDFIVALTGGGTLSITDFVANSDGNFFASDILSNSTGNTGNVGSNGPGVPSSVPEPSAMLLTNAGLGGILILVGARRRRKA
jgi:hypothetical protein